MWRRIKTFMANDIGATAIEYALIVGSIFLVIVTSLYTFQGRMGTVYQTIGNAMTSAGN